MTVHVPVPSKMEVIARAMASNGRRGDTKMAHMEDGEIVIPKQVAAENPDLAINALRAIRRSGGDPASYVVGSPSGNYNPTTGQQEFFWDKVFQVLAPAAVGAYVPNVGNLGMALTSAAANKLTGGSWEQAIASGLGSYVGGALSDSYFGNNATLGDATNKVMSSVGGDSGFYTKPASADFSTVAPSSDYTFTPPSSYGGGDFYAPKPQYGMSTDYGYVGARPDASIPDPSKSSGWLSDIGNMNARGVAAGLGGLAGSELLNMYNEYTAAPDLKPLSMPSYASLASQNGKANLPTPTPGNNVTNNNAPNPNTITPLPSDPGYGLPTGVSFMAPVKDRNTGSTRYMGIDEDEANLRGQRGRAYSWGNTLTM